ncbi:MAG: hypothetical protein CSA95_00630 [Bacteroidetes bacterium]|nr:MAG: hypothetical protein CSA95_00630 [Bacteroidota bacterium]
MIISTIPISRKEKLPVFTAQKYNFLLYVYVLYPLAWFNRNICKNCFQLPSSDFQPHNHSAVSLLTVMGGGHPITIKAYDHTPKPMGKGKKYQFPIVYYFCRTNEKNERKTIEVGKEEKGIY